MILAAIDPTATELVGNWTAIDGRVVSDETCKRIDFLTTSYLEKVAVDASGWNVLYRDPADKRHWMLTYPRSETHAGGPPALVALSIEEVARRFPTAGTL